MNSGMGGATPETSGAQDFLTGQAGANAAMTDPMKRMMMMQMMMKGAGTPATPQMPAAAGAPAAVAPAAMPRPAAVGGALAGMQGASPVMGGAGAGGANSMLPLLQMYQANPALAQLMRRFGIGG